MYQLFDYITNYEHSPTNIECFKTLYYLYHNFWGGACSSSDDFINAYSCGCTWVEGHLSWKVQDNQPHSCWATGTDVSWDASYLRHMSSHFPVG